MKSAFAAITTRGALLAAAVALCASIAAGGELLSQSASNLMHGLLMASFGNRNFDNIDNAIEDAFKRQKPDDINRIRLAMAMAKLGRPEAEKALAHLESWDNVYQGPDEEFRLSTIAQLHHYYLDAPEKAAEIYQRLVDGKDIRTASILSSLFAVYTGHPRTFDLEKAEQCLKQMEKLRSPGYILDRITFTAAKGDKERARQWIEQYEASIPPEAGESAKTYTAPAWGWLGETDRVAANLEAGLKEQAISYAPGGFRLYCDWVRQSPAFDAMRDDKRFVETWERLYVYEPEARGGSIVMPPLDGNEKRGAMYIPEQVEQK